MVKSTSENALINRNKLREPPQKSSTENAPSRLIILVGFMGAGKTSVGRALADLLHCPFEDLDDRIQCRERRTVPEIFRESGQVAFRRAEHEALQELLREPREGGKIVALGGGAFVQPKNFRLIASHGATTVFLDAGVATLWRRCRLQSNVERPLRQSLGGFRELYLSRRPHYLRATLRQRTGGKAIDSIAREIVAALDLKPKSPKRGAKQ